MIMNLKHGHVIILLPVPCCSWLNMQLHARMTVAGHFCCSILTQSKIIAVTKNNNLVYVLLMN